MDGGETEGRGHTPRNAGSPRSLDSQKGPSPGTPEGAWPLILDFRPPELGHSCCLKPYVRQFAPAAWEADLGTEPTTQPQVRLSPAGPRKLFLRDRMHSRISPMGPVRKTDHTWGASVYKHEMQARGGAVLAPRTRLVPTNEARWSLSGIQRGITRNI